MGRALLSLGSNIVPDLHLRSAARALRARFPGVVFSPVYRTRAVGFDGAEFLNAGAALDSDLAPVALDAWLHALEDMHGRDRSGPRFGPRTLDVDLVLFDDRILRGPGNLELPRPDLQHAFVLGPLADIAPDALEPRSGLSLAQMWSAHSQHGGMGTPEPWAL